MRALRWILVALCACGPLAGANGVALAADCDFSAIDQAVADLLTAQPSIQGVAVRLARPDDPVLYEAYFGSYGPDTVIPVASTSKVISAATLLSLVDAGLLGLDTTVSAILPQFTGDKGDITLRQAFSHTSGLPGGSMYPTVFDLGLTLEQGVDEIACCIALAAPPATQFWYGGLSMHVAGRMAEVVEGKSWDELFADRIAGPLGMTSTDYEGLGVTDNPRIAGGVRSSPADLASFMDMLARGGKTAQGQTVLSPMALDMILANQSMGLPIVDIPAGKEGTSYGLGVFRDVVSAEDEAIRVTDPGAFSTNVWIELDLGYSGVFMTEHFPFTDVTPTQDAVMDLARQEIATCAALPAASVPTAWPPASVLILLGIGLLATRRYARPATHGSGS